MSRLVKSILTPGGTGADGPHLADEDLARLAEGRVSGAERRGLIEHVNRCPRCWRVLSDTLADLPAAADGRSWWSRNSRQFISVAASVMVVVLIGGGVYEYHSARRAMKAAPMATAVRERKEEAPAPRRAPEPSVLAMKQAPAPAVTPSPAPRPVMKRSAAPPPAPSARARPDAEVQDNMTAAPPVRAVRPEAEARPGRVAVAVRPKRQAAPGLGASAGRAEGRKAPAAATLALDEVLRGLLLAGQQKGWRDAAARRALLAELSRRGLAVAGVRTIKWAGPRLGEDRPLAGGLKLRVAGEVLTLELTAPARP